MEEWRDKWLNGTPILDSQLTELRETFDLALAQEDQACNRRLDKVHGDGVESGIATAGSILLGDATTLWQGGEDATAMILRDAAKKLSAIAKKENKSPW